MAILIDKIQKQLVKTGFENRSKKARDWLKGKARDLGKANQRNVLRDTSRKADRFLPGRMYFYMYDPKTKETLPYYDTFPLVFPIELYSDGFLGLNLHYIRPNQRLVLLDNLYSTLNNDKFDDTTKLRLNYGTLSGVSRFKEYEPCIKRYLNSHIRSNIIEISPDEWEIAALLPFDNFVNATKTKVHRDSQEIIDGI